MPVFKKIALAVAIAAVGAVAGMFVLVNSADARDSSYVGWLEVRSTFGTGAACSLAVAAGSVCAAADIEAIDDLEVDDDSTLRSDVAIGGLLTGSGTAAWWSVASGANTACNTTCTAPCVMGFDEGAADAETIVACTDAAADKCLCAGAS